MRRKYDSEGRIPDGESRRSRNRKSQTRQTEIRPKPTSHTDTSSDTHCLKQENLPLAFGDVSKYGLAFI